MKRYAIGLVLATMLSASAPAFSQVFYTDYGNPYYGSYYSGYDPYYVGYNPYRYNSYYGYGYDYPYGYNYRGYNRNNSWVPLVRDIVRSVLY